MLSYNTSIIYGEGMFSYLWIRNTVDTQEFIDEVNNPQYIPVLESESTVLASFGDDIEGEAWGTTGVDDIAYWQIYRKKVTDNFLTFITRVPSNIFSIEDFTVLNNTEYQYTIFAETNLYLSSALEQVGTITPMWQDWSLIGLHMSDTKDLYYIDNDNIWKFNSNLQSSAMQQNLDKFTFENFTKYPKVATGNKNYLVGGITALLSNTNMATGKYSDTVEMYNRFVDFIATGGLKLLRDRKGNGWIIETTQNNLTYLDNTVEQITEVSFSFTQIGDIDSIQAVVI